MSRMNRSSKATNHAADAMGLPVRSAERLWTFCKAFLKNTLSK